LHRRGLAKRIVEKAARRGYIVTRGALELLERSEAPLEVLEKAILKLERSRSGSALIDEGLLKSVIKISGEEPREPTSIERADELEEDLRIEVDDRFLREWRIQGSSQEFREYFMSRYEKLSRILRRRLAGAIDLRSALKLKEGQEAYVIAMLLEKRESKKAWILRVDDPSAEAKVIFPKSRASNGNLDMLLRDAVFGIKVSKSGESLMAEEVVLPEVAAEDRGEAGCEAYACLISDIHLGSKHFRADLFESFLDWINRGRDPEAKRLRFLVIAGDLVDGVGVYPNQHKELEVFSVEEQVSRLSRLLEEVPENVKIIVGPGNHDPIRRALPQPPLQERYRRILERSGRSFIFVGNPAYVKLCGRSLLIYHGQGLDDVIQNLPRFSHSNLGRSLGKLLEILLRHRHLCPVYGESTPILPIREDLLVIDRVPSILHTGHVHVAYAGSYKGVRLINSGTWQEQTSYQRSAGLEPTVGVMALINFRNLSIKVRRFK